MQSHTISSCVTAHLEGSDELAWFQEFGIIKPGIPNFVIGKIFDGFSLYIESHSYSCHLPALA
jgi:hypothetical protein